MSKRTVNIQSPCRVGVKNCQLVIASENREASIPLEDVWVLILETKYATITSYALSEIVNNGIGVMVCDETHHPNGLLLPIGAHSRHAAIVKHQLAISKPLQKRLWQKLVQQKIMNQAQCLQLLGIEASSDLERIAQQVQSGDPTNKEGHAAEIYFRSFLPDGNRRNSPWTGALDYGYAIIRAGIARSAVSYGWLVSRGIHHSNELNAFNLVDDLIEPFRPVVDLMIGNNPPPETLTPTYKQYLVSAHEQEVFVNGKSFLVQIAIDEMLTSLKRAIIEGDSTLLRLPSLTKPPEKK